MSDNPTNEHIEGALAILKASRAIFEMQKETTAAVPLPVVKFVDALLFKWGRPEFVELVRKGLLLSNDVRDYPKNGGA